MRLRFTYDEPRDCFVCRFRLGKRYTDLRPTVTAASSPPSSTKPWQGEQAAPRGGADVRDHRELPQARAPEPSLRVESREVKVKGRKHINMAEILNEKGEVLARSQGLFIAIDPHKMFAKFVDR